MLVSATCTISAIGPDRFSRFRYLNPRRGEPGKAYTFAAGVLDDVWGFDPSAFAISPREATQMDPQQRLLLMLVWEALEDAGLPAARLSGRHVGVFVGNSGVDHSNRSFFDPAGTDSYMMTGNAGALLSNRISYIFDLHGPSLTVDTACSSSLVALDEAVTALRTGQIDTAIVAGVNLMLSPFPFVGFSAATMLSPHGLCRPFDKDADGYVRSEGGVVFVLQRDDDRRPRSGRNYPRIVETGVNSDGRTSGVALPSPAYQEQLLRDTYDRAGVDPGAVAFIEAHGTGTRVGDPAEAGALGRVLGQARTTPLPVGSVKSNVGHLEPASGLVGVLKAMLALENDYLPASLHFTTPNPDIPFHDLNLEVAGRGAVLARNRSRRYAGVNNFGFGGTNAHVIIADAPSRTRAPSRTPAAGPHNFLMVTARSRAALAQLAAAYGDSIADGADLGEVINAAGWQREPLSERLVVCGSTSREFTAALQAFAAGAPADNAACDTALATEVGTVLVFSGNGAQWPGMGRSAFRRNPHFARTFRRFDDLFGRHAGWSLEAALFADDLASQLASTRVAQPLLFALQVSLASALRALGLRIDGVIGHSVGEVAAAWVAGALTCEQAVGVIYARSQYQELSRGSGKMAAVNLSEAAATALLHEAGIAGVEISAINSPRSVSVSGSETAIGAFVRFAQARNLAATVLDIDYPFHSSLLDGIRGQVIDALAATAPARARLPFYSTVLGRRVTGPRLGATYWWDNVRQPVRFADAVTAASTSGCRLFMEIGPRPILKRYVTETTADLDQAISVIHSLEREESADTDPVWSSFARAMAAGAAFDPVRVFGRARHTAVQLPLYPWQNECCELAPSPEALEVFSLSVLPHPLLGQQLRRGEHVWQLELDVRLLPFLNDHKVDGQVILPGAAYAEMALAAAADWLGHEQVELRDMDIAQPLLLGDDYSVQVRTRLSVESGTVEIASRRRLSTDDWLVHAKCRVASIPTADVPVRSMPPARAVNDPGAVERVYRSSAQYGLEFGPLFRRLIRCEEPEEDVMELEFCSRDPSTDPSPGETRDYLLHPLDLDGCFQGLSLLYDKIETGADNLAFIPVFFGALRIHCPHVCVRAARILVQRSNRREIVADFELFSITGEVVATLTGARFRAAALVKRHTLDRTSYCLSGQLQPLPSQRGATAAPQLEAVIAHVAASRVPAGAATGEQRLLLEAAARRVAYDALAELSDDLNRLDMTSPSIHGGNGLLPLHGPANGADAAPGHDHRVSYVSALLAIAEQSGLATQAGDHWQIAADCPLPPAPELVATLLQEEPRWLAEAVLLTRAATAVSAHLAGSAQSAGGREAFAYSSAMLEHHDSSSPTAAAHIGKVAAVVERIAGGWPQNRPLRVLELGVASGGLSRALVPILARHDGCLVAADTDKARVDRLRILFDNDISFEARHLDGSPDGLACAGPFDLMVSANGLWSLSNRNQVVEQAAGALADGAVAVLSVGESDVFHEVVLGLVDGWFDPGIAAHFPLSPMGTLGQWTALLATAGLGGVTSMPVAEDLDSASVIVARKEPRPATGAAEPGPPQRTCVVVTTGCKAETAFCADLESALATHATIDRFTPPGSPRLKGRPARHRPWSQVASVLSARDGDQATDIMFLAGAFADSGTPVADRVKWLTGCLQTLGDVPVRLWVVAPGGARGRIGLGASSPGASAIWAYARTATNEYGSIDLRVVDFAQDLDPGQSASQFALMVCEPGDETEVVLAASGLRALRMERGLATRIGQSGVQDPGADACVLSSPRSGSLDRLGWIAVAKRAPDAGEVQIEVAATGLNFRDVMWAQGLLPEEALEDGFAGPTLGFECSGRITALGKSVTGLKLGDPVMALAPACFASHVTVPAVAVSRVPDRLDLVAAATVPVAFLTSYYALHHLARLQAGEWVLIHGAAGGVGLAALQVARHAGARVIATAGSDEKRDFLRLMGADFVLDTRTLEFADQVRAITGADGDEGVDVVLNSLAGEAMERSLELVRPFGRFLELGKRDFYGNTKIGLRPLRRNVSYFGIDADQLLKRQPALSQRLFAELAQLFGRGDFTPLPYRLFDSPDIVEAFRLMQQSGHVGKILVKGPRPGSGAVTASDGLFAADPEGVHVITGGLGGFGLEAALWLADHGARSIVLTSRSGTLNDQARSALEQLGGAGVATEVAVCDVTDEGALADLLARLRTDRPIKGVLHAAMVLDDALIHNLDGSRIDAVLAPKIAGAENLDRLTRQDALDYFVLFSSASAMFGNPGQAHYVAANAYLDGLACRRRQEGLPALAVGWGAITDVGVLARQTETAESLARHTGGIRFTARQGLNLLGQLLSCGPRSPVPAALTLAAMDWAFAGDTLPIMSTPLFSGLTRELAGRSGSHDDTIDIFAMISSLDDSQARERVAALLAEEVGMIFRMPPHEINLKRSLADIGMDSLMGMELRTAAKQRFGVELPMASIADGTTIVDIASRIVDRARSFAGDTGRTSDAILIAQHSPGAGVGDAVESILEKVRDEDGDLASLI